MQADERLRLKRFEEVSRHPFFQDVDWKSLERNRAFYFFLQNRALSEQRADGRVFFGDLNQDAAFQASFQKVEEAVLAAASAPLSCDTAEARSKEEASGGNLQTESSSALSSLPAAVARAVVAAAPGDAREEALSELRRVLCIPSFDASLGESEFCREQNGLQQGVLQRRPSSPDSQTLPLRKVTMRACLPSSAGKTTNRRSICRLLRQSLLQLAVQRKRVSRRETKPWEDSFSL